MPDEDKLHNLNTKDPWQFFAVGFGIGTKARRPGTYASLCMIPFCFIFVAFPFYLQIITELIFMLLCCYAVTKTVAVIGVENKHKIACDEFLGMLVSCTGLNSEHWIFVILAYLVFRFFDLISPFPISWCSKRIPAGISIVADDIYCGLCTFFVLKIVAIIMMQTHGII